MTRAELTQLAERVMGGRIWIGNAKQPLRNGSTEIWMQWEARLLPARVCEGGGWYSASRTDKAWSLRTRMEHKNQGLYFDKVADPQAPETVEALFERLAEVTAFTAKKYGFSDTPTAAALLARAAECEA